LIKGKQITGTSSSEENLSGLNDVTPFLLESKLLSLGALYSKGDDYISHVVADGDIITGQNPASSKEVAQKIIELVKKDKFIDKLLQPVSD
jgi:putative intracellular protease/amidase